MNYRHFHKHLAGEGILSVADRPGTLGSQGVDTQVDPQCSVPGRPPGLGGRPHTQDILEEEMFQLPVSSIKSFVLDRPGTGSCRPGTLNEFFSEIN